MHKAIPYGSSQMQYGSIIMYLMIVHEVFKAFRFLFTTVPALALLSAVMVVACLCNAQADSVCAGDIASTAPTLVVENVSDRAELTLSDGRVMRLQGVVFPSETRAAHAIRDIMHDAKPVIASMSAKADRWGRYSGQIAIIHDGKMILVIEELIAQGHAFVRSDDVLPSGKRGAAATAAAVCLKHLEALEAAARSAKLGIWGSALAFPLDAKNTSRLQQFEGQFVVVEGKIISIGERKAMTFLNFGTSWSRDFSVMISRNAWNKMISEGISSQALTGKKVLIRGYLRLRENVLQQDDIKTGRAPHIRLLGTRDITIMDTD